MELRYNLKNKELSPISILLGFEVVKNAEDIEFLFNTYVNGVFGKVETKSREFETILNIGELYDNLESLLNNLKLDEELAIASLIKKDGEIYHIPLIDFFESESQKVYDSMERLQEKFNYDVYLFQSGRSYHGYMDASLSTSDWLDFLSALLLLNNQDNYIIDARWVAHSMRQRFSSLRISCNTPAYIAYPISWQKIPKRRH